MDFCDAGQIYLGLKQARPRLDQVKIGWNRLNAKNVYAKNVKNRTEVAEFNLRLSEKKRQCAGSIRLLKNNTAIDPGHTLHVCGARMQIPVNIGAIKMELSWLNLTAALSEIRVMNIRSSQLNLKLRN